MRDVNRGNALFFSSWGCDLIAYPMLPPVLIGFHSELVQLAKATVN